MCSRNVFLKLCLSQILTEASDKEIYQAVIDAITACENIDVIGDVDDEPVQPRPIRRDVLKAASTIGKYTNELNDPLARKIEALLGSFNRKLCLEETTATKDGVLTDYFQRLQMLSYI